MVSVMPRSDRVEATNIELWGLYNIERNSYLNMLYYGDRATFWSNWNTYLQLGAALGSLGAVGGLLALGSSGPAGQLEWGWKLAAALVGLASGVCGTLPTILGLSDKINRFQRLHFAYCQLFHLAKQGSMDIRREGYVTVEQVGMGKTLSDIYSRFGQSDAPDLKDKLRDKYELETREKYPPDSLWYASEPYENSHEAITAIAPSTTAPAGETKAR